MAVKEITGPGDIAENSGSPLDFSRTDPIVKALTTDSGKLGEMFKMSNMSAREQAKARRQLDIALRYGVPQVVMDILIMISGSPGVDGHRAEQVTAMGGISGGYYKLPQTQRGRVGRFMDKITGAKTDTPGRARGFLMVSLDLDLGNLGLDEIEMSFEDDDGKGIGIAMAESHGLQLIIGATGSGKSALGHMWSNGFHGAICRMCPPGGYSDCYESGGLPYIIKINGQSARRL